MEVFEQGFRTHPRETRDERTRVPALSPAPSVRSFVAAAQGLLAQHGEFLPGNITMPEQDCLTAIDKAFRTLDDRMLLR
jgi:hypothetical protein